MDLVLRATIGYFFLLLVLRATGKRELGQLSPIDLVILLIISEALQEALTDGDRSVVGGMILVTTLAFWHGLLTLLTYRSSALRDVLNGVPVVLVADGVAQDDAMRAERVPEDDILSEARQVGLESMEQVKTAVLESTGKISIIPKRPEERHARGAAEQAAD